MKRVTNYFNEHTFRALIEQSEEGVAILSAEGAALYISPSIKKILGYTVEEVKEMGLFILMHPDDVVEMGTVLQRVLENPGVPLKGHTGRMRHKDGSWRWLEATVTNLLHDPAINGIVDNFRDITEIKESEAALRKSEMFSKGILASLGSHIAVIEQSGNIIAVNKAWDDFAKENGANNLEKVSNGSNYFDVCSRAAAAGDFIAELANEGIKAVFGKEQETFQLEYPCNSPQVQRWFVLSASNFGNDGSKVVVTHLDITARKIAEESLHRSQSNLKAIIENTDASIYSLDSELRYITFNQQMKNSLLQVYDLIISPGDKVYEFLEKLEPDEAKAWERIYRRALQGETVKFEKQFHVNDYHDYFDFSIYPIWDDDKNVIGLSCFAFDVTEQKKVKEALRQSELRYRQIVETAQEGIWLVDENQLTVFVNNKLCEILGYEKQEMIGKPVYAFIDEEGRQVKDKRIQDNKEGGISQGEFKYISKTGKEVWSSVSANSIYREDGTYGGTLRMVTDITIKRKLDVLLAQANSLARLGNWEADLVKDTLYWSPVTKEIHEVPQNFTPYPAAATDYYKPGFSQQAITQAIEEAIHKNTGWDLELQIITAKGNTSWVRTIGEAECFDGKCIRMSGSIQDIDGMKRSEVELKDKNKELKELSSYLQNVRETERKHIAREVHDELGQLASSLQIDIDWLRNKTGGMGENVNDRIDHAGKIIKELITTIRKIASGLRPSLLDDFGLNAAMQWYCNEFQQLNNIECEFIEEFNDENLAMEIKTELFRMSQESLTNVMRHSSAQKVTVSITEDADKIYLSVTDNGVGFDTARRKNTLGLLGLRERAVSINGELNIISSPGKGTTISATITKK